MRFSYRKSSDGISRKIKLCDFLRMCNPDILQNSALIDSEQQLMRIDGEAFRKWFLKSVGQCV